MRPSSVRTLAMVAAGAALGACGSSHASGPSAPVVDAGGAEADADGGADAGGQRSCVVSVPMPSDWRLRTDGEALRDALGRQVFLRGVNAGGRSKFSPYVPFDYAPGQFAAALGAYMDRAASWGIDAIRIPFAWAALEPMPGQQDTQWLSQVQQLVDAAWARGIWVVIDFHQDVYSESFCGDGFPSWTIPNAPAPHHDCPTWSTEYFNDTAMQQAFDAFWAQGSTVFTAYLAAWDTMLARFRDEPGVVGFEPMNEPGPGSAAIDPFESTTLTAFYAQVVPHFRQAAPQSLVFVEGGYLDGARLFTSLTRPAGDGIVFAPHFYPPAVGAAQVLSKLQAWATVGTSWNVPVFLGEFGLPHGTTGALDYATACFGALDALGMSGTQWEYSVSADEWNSESYEVVAADGTEYPDAQALVRPFARAVAGTGIVQSWDASASTFTLSYAPTPGATELQFPSRAYPQGYAVSITGGCFDATSAPGKMLVQPDPGATQVSLQIAPK